MKRDHNADFIYEDRGLNTRVPLYRSILSFSWILVGYDSRYQNKSFSR